MSRQLMKIILGGILLSVMFSCQVSADTMYLPDVTPAMSNPEYWVEKETGSMSSVR